MAKLFRTYFCFGRNLCNFKFLKSFRRAPKPICKLVFGCFGHKLGLRGYNHSYTCAVHLFLSKASAVVEKLEISITSTCWQIWCFRALNIPVWRSPLYLQSYLTPPSIFRLLVFRKMKLFSIFSLFFLSTSIVALPSTPSFVVAKTTNVVLREEVDVNRLGMDLVGKVGRGGALVTKEQFLMVSGGVGGVFVVVCEEIIHNLTVSIRAFRRHAQWLNASNLEMAAKQPSE